MSDSNISQKKILSIDDEPLTLMGLKLCFKRDQRYSFSSTTSFSEAIVILGIGKFDLVVIDFNLGKDSLGNRIEGSHLAKVIKSSWPSIKIVILTGKEKSTIEKECLDAGADIVIEKDKMHQEIKDAFEMMLFGRT